ncbi:MAG: nucleotidyltransferase domain-containing protein [Candidatus Thermoplasmatota archaeon]|nr:nucleotidyltransferase domain-containing protein [Candidatus Thermoplasmatota archaeon]
MDSSKIKKIKKDFNFLHERVMAVLLFGSFVKGEESTRSDVDICIIAPYEKDKINFLGEIMSKTWGYDVRLFELMPLYMKMEVIKNHKIIYARNISELYEYFYFYRKLWKDQEQRQRITKEEAIRLFE